mgnify:CR=1 FL=1
MEHPENNEAYKGLVVNAGIEQPRAKESTGSKRRASAPAS